MMKQGKLIAKGKPQEIMTSELLKEVYNIQAQIHKNPISNTPMCLIE